MTWILILMMSFSGWVKGVKIESISGFQSKAACLEAAGLVMEHSTKRIIGLCVPTDVIEKK